MHAMIKLLNILMLVIIIISSKICLGALTCSISSPTLNFGSINPYDTIPETSTTTVAVTCTTTITTTVSYTITTQNLSNRKMNKNQDKMSYDLYSNSTFSVKLSNSSGYSNSYSLSNGQSKTDYFIIYGMIPVQPVSPQGTYTDTVTLVLDYNG